MKRLLTITFLCTFPLWFAASCGDQATAVAVNEACKQTENRSVKVEGYFRLPQSSAPPLTGENDPRSYMLLLVEKENGTGSFINVQVPFTGSKERNRLDTLPASYTYNDLHVNTDSGAQVSSGDKVAVTGQVLKDSKACIVRVEKIEKP